MTLNAKLAWYDDYLTLYWYDQYTRTNGAESFRKYDPARITRELLGLGADIYVIYAVSQMGDAYYPSRILPPHPALKGRDYVGDLTTRLKQAGKRVVLYINWGTSRRPEWREVGPDGKPSQKWDTNYYVPCLNSPQQDVIRRVTEELVDRYSCDGLSLDMYVCYERCTCQYCQPHLRQLFGLKRKVTDADILARMPAYMGWRDDVTSRYLGDLNGILAAKGIVPFHNGSSPLYGNMAAGGRKWIDQLDPYMTEVYNYNATLGIQLHHAMKRTSCALMTSTPVHFAHTPVAPAEFIHHAANVKGNAGRIFGVCGVGAYPDTTSSRRLLANVQNAFEFYKRDAEFYRGATPAGEVALVYSYETRRFDMQESQGQAHNIETFGLSRTLQETHVPWTMLIAELDDTVEALQRYRLLILPATTCLSDRFVASLAAYIKGGGRVLATGVPGLWKTADIKRRSYPLTEALGFTPKGENAAGCFHVEDAFEPIALVGKLFNVKAQGQVLRRVIPAGADHPVFVQKDIVPADRPAGPAVIQQRYGRGTSVSAVFEPGRFYYEQGHYQVRELLESLLEAAYPAAQRLIRTNLPDTVEITVTKQAEQGHRIVHLINKTTNGHYMGRETNHLIHNAVPVNDVELEIQNVPKDAKVTFINTKGTVQKGATLKVRLPRLDTHAAIVIGIRKEKA